jgi:hypothetical protein
LSPGPHALTARATDNLGATFDSTPINLKVVTKPKLSGALRTTDAKLKFALEAIKGEAYLIQRSSDLKNWTTIQTVTAASEFEVIADTPPLEAQTMFYRAQIKP